jgi:hypothetical protein
MIYNISDQRSDVQNQGSFLLHSNNEMLPICFGHMSKYSKYKNIYTVFNLRRWYRRTTYSDFNWAIRQFRDGSKTGFEKISISNRELIIGLDFCYDLSDNKILYAVMAPKDKIEEFSKISSDQCILYISNHFTDFTNYFKKTVLQSFDNFLGDMVITKFPNQKILGHPLFKPKSKKEINQKIKTLINEL